jgi:hypothetical protein
MTKTVEEANKALVLEAFDTLFNRRNILEDAAYRINAYQQIAHGMAVLARR